MQAITHNEPLLYHGALGGNYYTYTIATFNVCCPHNVWNFSKNS